MKIKERWVSWEELDLLLPGLSPTSIINFSRIGGLIPGSIPFADATGLLTEYNTGLFFDETNVRLGVGTGGPVCTGHLQSAVCPAYAGLHPDTVLLLENDDNVTLQFQCATTGEARIRFADDDFNPSAGMIDYEFTNDYMVFGVATSVNMYLTPIGLGAGNVVPTNPFHVLGPGTDEGGLAGGSDVAARFQQTNVGHTGISIDAQATYDPVLYLAEDGEAMWDIRNDASESDEFQIRWQGRAVVNRTDFIIDATGNVEIPTGNLTVTGIVSTPEIYNTGGDLKIQPDVQGDAIFFGDTDVADAADGRAVYIYRRAVEFDRYFKFFFDQYGSAVIDIQQAGGTNLHNIFVGQDAGSSVTTGKWSVFIGDDAGKAAVSSFYNVMIGYKAGEFATGGNNVLVGNQAGASQTTATDCTYIGHQAGFNSTSPIANVAIGTQALFTNIIGFSNMALGHGAGFANTANYGVFVGSGAGAGNTTGLQNTYIGYRAGFTNQTGSYNVFIQGGSACGIAAADNVVIGAGAGNFLTGQRNVYIGRVAAYTAVNEWFSVVIGSYASYFNSAGTRNTIVGYTAGYGAAGQSHSYNAFFGYEAGKDVTTGGFNTMIGTRAGEDITSGARNVCIGYQAGSGQLTVDSDELWIANSNTATPLIYGEFPNALLRVQATDFNVIGTCNLGDGGVTNYAEIKADGEVNLHGTARVVNGQWIDAQAIKAPTTNPAQLISHGILETPAFQFADAIEANQENVTFNMRVPNKMDRGVAPTLSCGWSADGISPGNCRWQLEYLYTKLDDDTGAAAQATVAVTSTASATADGMVVATFPALALPEATDICIHCRITRLSADVLDTIADTVEMHGVCLSYTSDRLGTAT